MSSFLALYRGPTVATARLVGITADPNLVADVAAQLLHEQSDTEADPALMSLRHGQRSALRIIAHEAQQDVEG